MEKFNPLQKSKEDYSDIIKKIGTNTGVGIDAQLTHAIIIDFLREIKQRIEKIEEKLAK